ncbi:MAG: butyrate kinase [Clostridia bacterium]|nr:butyrate kinase [Clostridia bacterium]
MKLLIINPGSTSTKISLFENEQVLFEENVFHDAPELLRYPTVNDQMPFRKALILQLMEKYGYAMAETDCFVGRGGSAYSQRDGVTLIDERLYMDTVHAVGGSDHPAKLGVMLAYELGLEYDRPAYTLDPTNVDELCDLARLTGIRGVYRNAQFHVLNQKAVARKHARSCGKRYEDCSFIVAHIDGGITVNAHLKGRMVDGNVGAGGDGPYTPTRIGSVPILPLMDYIDAHSTADVRRMCSRSGGFVSMFGTADGDEIHRRVLAGDKKACLVWQGMIYQIGKMIGEMAAVLCGKVDGILLTGGYMRFPDLINTLKEMCGWIAPISVYPGEMEQEALALAVYEALNGKREIRAYSGRPVWEGFEGLDL